MSYSFDEPALDPADERRCPQCGNDPCLCEQYHDCGAPHCKACGLCDCKILWRRGGEPGYSGWDFMSRCCEADVVHSDGSEFTFDEAEDWT